MLEPTLRLVAVPRPAFRKPTRPPQEALRILEESWSYYAPPDRPPAGPRHDPAAPSDDGTV